MSRKVRPRSPSQRHGRMSSERHFLAIHALVELKATEALPRLRQLLDDNARSNFGKLESVAEAAQAAIAKLQSLN